MSQHKDKDTWRLEMALRTNNLPVNSPSMLSDSFRNGWYACIIDEEKSISEVEEGLEKIEKLNLSNKGK